MITPNEIKALVQQLGGAKVVAEKTGLWVNTIYRISNGVSKPSYDTLEKLEELRNAEVINS
jgi:transcriptional regulator with XRE-family HTH domain